MIRAALHPHQMTNTHLLVHEFDYWEPATLQEAVALLREHGTRARPLAGGTFLLIQMKMEKVSPPEHLVNVQKLPGLTGVALEGDGAHLGPCTTIYALRQAPLIQSDYAALAEACAAFGSTQIQVMGTVGGNLCNGSPASDTVPALMVFDAQLTLTGPNGKRIVPVEEFLVGPGETALRQGELLTSIMLPRPQRGRGSAFVKISRVAADLAKASAAAAIVRDGDQIVDCRLAFGSVAPTVMRARRAEETLTGQTFSPELALEAGEVASREVSPIDDVRSTAWYRREVVKVVTHDALCAAWQRAKSASLQVASADDAVRSTPYAARSTLHVARNTQHEIELVVNGEKHRLWVAPNELLLNVLRERLELTGTKYGCGIGECGACTVLMNGAPVLSCLVLAIAADGSEVLTVEGLQGPVGKLDPLQDAFIEHQAFQCGYCTPGMLMMTKHLLSENPSPTEDEIRDYLRGNRCRCTGFASIVRAVMSCAQGDDVISLKQGREA
jgi:xanthine dehydrogenase iron-sulfur cluster and FAD-binding subunit A